MALQHIQSLSSPRRDLKLDSADVLDLSEELRKLGVLTLPTALSVTSFASSQEACFEIELDEGWGERREGSVLTFISDFQMSGIEDSLSERQGETLFGPPNSPLRDQFSSLRTDLSSDSEDEIPSVSFPSSYRQQPLFTREKQHTYSIYDMLELDLQRPSNPVYVSKRLFCHTCHQFVCSIPTFISPKQGL